MRRELAAGYELDDDVERVDVDAVHRYLSEESYWARGRPREVVERSIRTAARVVGLYHDGRPDARTGSAGRSARGGLVGFARVVSDEMHMAYLADVFVDGAHRGRGLGVELVTEAVERGPHAELLWFLGTRDAHTMYEKLGFGPPDGRWMVRCR